MRPYIAYENTSFDWYDGVATAKKIVTEIAATTGRSGSVPRAQPRAINRIHATNPTSSSVARSVGVIHCTVKSSRLVVSAEIESAAYTSTVPSGSVRATCSQRCRTSPARTRARLPDLGDSIVRCYAGSSRDGGRGRVPHAAMVCHARFPVDRHHDDIGAARDELVPLGMRIGPLRGDPMRAGDRDEIDAGGCGEQ